jgi:iron complex outermembrane receptor protein
MPIEERRTAHQRSEQTSRAAQPVSPPVIQLAKRPIARTLSVAICCLASVAMTPGAAQAQAPAETQSPEVLQSYSIPPGALAPALRSLASSANLLLTFTDDQTGGKSTAGVSGRHTPRSALAALLTGTGLRAVQLDRGGFVLRADPAAPPAADAAGTSDGTSAGTSAGSRAASTGDAVLPVVTVRGTAVPETATGPISGYAAQRSATATKTDTPLSETPQSVSVVGSQQIRETGSLSLNSVLNYTAGVNSAPYTTSTRLDGGVGRSGAELETYLDGLDTEIGYWARSVRMEPYSLERVEVLRGPASTQVGQSSTGGIVNAVSKDPQAEALREVGVQVGSFGLRQLQTDLTGPLSADGRWLYRLVAVGRESDTQVDMTPDDRRFIAPSLTWKPTSSTDWTFRLRHQRDRAGADSGAFPWVGTVLPNPNGRIPVRLFPAEPNADFFNADSTSAGWTFEHRFNDRWKVRQNIRTTRTHVHYGAIDLRPSDDPEVSPYLDDAQRVLDRDAYYWDIRSRTFAADQNVQGSFQTGPIQHRVLAGVDLLRYTYRQLSAYDSSDAPGSLLRPLDVYAPSYDYSYVPPAYDGYSRTRISQTGVYLQDQLRMQQWTVVAGIRHDRARSAQLGEVDWNTPVQNDRATTKRLGLLHSLAGGWVPYLSYAESFQPQGATAAGQALAPLRGKQFEAGLRYAPEGGRYRAHAAVYDLREVNRVVQLSGLDFTQTGKVRSRGFELELVGRLTRALSVNASYNYTDADAELSGTPRHRAAIWGVQRFQLAGQHGFSAGAGVRYNAAYKDHVAPVTPSFTLFDAMLAWETTQWRLALNVSNLADKEYFGTCESWGICTYGGRRTAVVSATYRF